MLCAARGSSIFVFGADGSCLSSWQHPAAQGKADRGAAGDGTQEPERPQEQTGESSPAPKRRKVDSEAGVHVDPTEPTDGTANPADGKADGNGQKSMKKGRAKFSDARGQEYPIINILKATPDGNHVVAVTGQDKIIWVLEHNGQGQLKELSQR
jgi:tRNA (guanine-N(7)-)-methyltransferase subunit TRM82